MTLDEAKRIKSLLDTREHLLYELELIEISGGMEVMIFDGSNGIPRRWEQGKNSELEYLKAGYKADIEKIEHTLRCLPSLPQKEDCEC